MANMHGSKVISSKERMCITQYKLNKLNELSHPKELWKIINSLVNSRLFCCCLFVCLRLQNCLSDNFTHQFLAPKKSSYNLTAFQQIRPVSVSILLIHVPVLEPRQSCYVNHIMRLWSGHIIRNFIHQPQITEVRRSGYITEGEDYS